jgi:hypothetical protein
MNVHADPDLAVRKRHLPFETVALDKKLGIRGRGSDCNSGPDSELIGRWARAQPRPCGPENSPPEQMCAAG